MKTRLNKIIAEAGVASRREADQLIKGGKVTVNGEVINEPGLKFDPENDHVKVSGKLITKIPEKIYILLNKPKGYVTTTFDPEGRPTVMDLVRRAPGRLFPVGRLDLQTEGLLLLTNDGEFANNVIRPSKKVKKIYELKIRGKINQNLKKKLEYGIKVEGKKLKLESIELIKEDKNSWYRVTIYEGKNRQIRRIFDSVKHSVVKLRRVQIGNLAAPDLPLGQFIYLNKNHLEKIFERKR
jgi:23S rRNA pseudouridine2605 synthase